MRARDVDPQRVQRALERLSVELVATAHPTEVSRRAVLGRHLVLDSCLTRLDNSAASPGERREVTEQFLEDITLLWQTDPLYDRAPKVVDEVERVLFFFDRVLIDESVLVLEALEREVERWFPGTAAPRRALRFGSWAGGDQDGNPNATADQIREAVGRRHSLAERSLDRRLGALVENLAVSDRLVEVSPTLVASLERDAERDPEGAELLAERFPREPYRRKLELIRRRLRGAAPGYSDPEELVDELEDVRASLRHHQGGRVADRSLARLIRHVEIFGFHLAGLDVRQHSSIIGATAAGTIGHDPDVFAELPEPDRVAALVAALEAPEPPPPVEDEPYVASLIAVRDAITQHGEHAAGELVVSFTSRVSDLLAVLVVARSVGLVDAREHTRVLERKTVSSAIVGYSLCAANEEEPL